MPRARERVEREIGHPVKRLCGTVEIVLHGYSLVGLSFLSCADLEDLVGRVAGEREAVAVSYDVGCRTGVDEGGGDGSVHHALSCLLVACLVDLGGLDVDLPLFEGWAGVA